MKIIVSHDVDHLFGKDHWFRDFIYPKMWIKAILHLVKGDITPKESLLRLVSCFKRNRHCIDELMRFDEEHGVKSTFFFGMNQGLGMSYTPDEAFPVIQRVKDQGFDIGVHGVEFDSYTGIRRERDAFAKLMGFEPCGIRMHYVRFDETTFRNESNAGYSFDTTEFDKKSGGTIKNPYKIGQMWEFPLTIMDGYLPQKIEAAKKLTLERLELCRKSGIEYVSVLFHDYQFCDAYFDMREWYKWFICMIEESELDYFISYKQAIKELEDVQ